MVLNAPSKKGEMVGIASIGIARVDESTLELHAHISGQCHDKKVVVHHGRIQ